MEKISPGWMIFIGKLYSVYVMFIWFRGTLPRFRADQLMAFAWKVLVPLAIVNVFVSALEVFIWTEYDLSAGVVLPIFAVVNFALAGALIAGFGRMIGRDMERFPKRPRLVSDIDVPLPEPATA